MARVPASIASGRAVASSNLLGVCQHARVHLLLVTRMFSAICQSPVAQPSVRLDGRTTPVHTGEP